MQFPDLNLTEAEQQQVAKYANYVRRGGELTPEEQEQVYRYARGLQRFREGQARVTAIPPAGAVERRPSGFRKRAAGRRARHAS